ncbi:hypothetical protein [Gymnodinialimonas ceratoperidinii]|uniref:Type IV pilus biogenesis n=1 Tax=Gymnodinialimonas ceratoperidinii TaxID=2856823 RepID=A0A8F6U0T4_9RHOB|nr:hypothetical protein [Gymnodinialimonas ceratoperidinii]QXT41297.1 hypothetical protein KYE46_08825 [Gymnodinialimonas ceratoperidinii]
MNIALFLSSDGIALAHRQAAGHWAMIGETALDVPDLGATLSGLRDLAVEREGDDFETLLVLPDDQILYTSLTAPTADADLTAYRIEEGLEGLTPYAVTELEYDWQVLEEDRVKIAVVARETLDEARGFAKEHGFTCKGFAAMPPMERFPGVPTFDLGAEAKSMGFSAEGIAFGPDTHGQPEPAADPEEASAPSDEAKAEDSAAPDAKGSDEAASPDAATDTDSSEAGADTLVPEAIAPLEDTPSAEEHPALAEALLGAGSTDDGSDAPLQAIEDPSVSGPITSIAEDDQPDQPTAFVADSTPPQEVVGDAGDDDDVLPPAPSPASREARQRARALRDGQSSAEGVSGNETPPEDSGAGQFIARRGPSAAPGAGGRSITAPSAGSGAISAPDSSRGSLVGQRSSRIGLTHPDEPGKSAESAGAASTTPTAPTPDEDATASPMPRLAEQLQRVRNASKSRPITPSKKAPPRPRVEIEPGPAAGVTGATASRRPSPFDEPPAGEPKSSSAKDRLSGLLNRGSKKSFKAAPAKGATSAAMASAPVAASAASGSPQASGAETGASGITKAVQSLPLGRRKKAAASTTPDVASGDERFSSGLLARKYLKPTGGSFRTGVILTVILLLLLALVAIWSALFIPNGAVARFFGTGGEVEASAGLSDGFAPEVTTSTPAFGTEIAQPTLIDEAAADGIELAENDPTVVIDTPVEVAEEPTPAPEEEDVAALPDIDADLDLPPLPEIDQGRNPSVEEAEALYAEDGIWARSPERPDLRSFDLLDRVYTAAIDPEVNVLDAVALPDPGINPAETLARFPPPPAFGTEFDVTDEGLIAATPEGVLTPEGAFVILGTPPTLAVQRPREIAEAAPAVVDTDAAVLSALRPSERPGDLSETRERQVLGGLTSVELSERRPSTRPASPQEAAAEASLFPEGAGADPDAVDAAVEQALAGTDLAVARSLMPRTRPANIAQIVASAERTPTEAPTAVAASAVAPGPSIPSNADVSRAATERNAIRLRNVNLIGVTGTSSSRRALVRLSSGRFVRVSVGDRLDGGRVAAIGETTLQYVRSGRTVTLEIPG